MTGIWKNDDDCLHGLKCFFFSMTDCRIAFIFVSFYHLCPGVIAFFDSSCKTFQLSVEEQRLTPSIGEWSTPAVWSFRREFHGKVCLRLLQSFWTSAWKIKILYLHHSYLLLVATTGSNYPLGFTYSLFIQKHTVMRIFREAFMSTSMISKYKFLACSYKLEKFFASIFKLSSPDTTGWNAAIQCSLKSPCGWDAEDSGFVTIHFSYLKVLSL